MSTADKHIPHPEANTYSQINMCDEFWDFLNDKLDPEKRGENKCNGEVTEVDHFWDYIEPLPSYNQSEPHLRQLDQASKDDFYSPSYSSRRESGSSRLHYDYNFQYDLESHKKTSDVCLKQPVKSDEEFWDFLKSNSTVEELQRVYDADTTPQETPHGKEGKSESFHPSTGDSGYQSLDSMSISFPESGDFENRNLDSSGKKNPEIPIKKRIDIQTEIRKDNFESQFVSTQKSSGTVDPNRPTLNNYKSPSKEKSSKISDDEFWDFLNSDSPVVGLNEVLQELPTYLNTALSDTLYDSEVSYNSALHEESPFGTVSNFSDTARHSVENDSTISCDISTLRQLDSKNIQDNNNTKTNERKSEFPIQKDKIKRNLISGYNEKTIDESMQEKIFQNKNKVENVKPRPVCNSLIQNEKFSIANRSGKTNIKLPCISSEFSFTPYPDWLNRITQNTLQNSALNESHQNSAGTVSHKIIQESKLQEQEVNKSFKYRHSLTSSPLGCSQNYITDSAPNSSLTKAGNETSKAQNMQRFDHQTLVSNSELTKIEQKQTVFYPITSSTSSGVTSHTKSKDANTRKSFYLLLPQNQNSNFLVLVNNATESGQPLSDKNNSTSSLPSSLNKKSTNNPMKISLENQTRLNGSLDYQVNNFQVKTGNSNVNDVFNSEVLKVEKKITLDKNLIQNSTINLSNGRTQATHFQPIESVSSEKFLINTFNKKTSILPNHDLTNSSVPASTLSTKDLKSLNLFRNIKPIQTPLQKLNTKPICSTVKQPLMKPIKSISLGKDKHAIQQTSTPLKMGSISEGKQLCDHQGNVINYFCYSNNSSLYQDNDFTYDTIDSQCDKVNIDRDEQKLNSNSSKPSYNHILATTSVTMASDSTKIPDPSHAGPCNTAIIDTDPHLQNTGTKDQDTNHEHSLKQNLISVSETVLLNTNTLISNNCRVENLKPLVSTSCINKLTNNYVQVKIAPSQQKPVTNLPDLFPPPISMVPVCVVPNTKTAIQPKAQKVLVLKGLGQQNVVQQNFLPKRFPASQKTTSVKKSVTKAKKTGRKTVRELLEERQQNMVSQLGNKPRKELRVLRPVQKIAPCSTLYSTNIPNKVVAAATGMNGNGASSLANDLQQRDFSKRPNILMLPSANKTLKKNIIRDETNSFVSNQKNLQSVDSPDFKISHQGKPNFRPRHYDMSELQIGYFHVDDDMDSRGRFRSKFKVIFTKRQFLYEFPVCQCNQVELKSSDIWEQMVRIIVPFQIITSMDLSDRTIHFSINSTPLTCLGRIQARSGIISNATVYDTPVESNSPWDDAIRSSFNHKIVLRKRQVNKLKSVLYQFDAKFIALSNNDRSQSDMHSSNLSFEGELSPSTLKKSLTKNKKACIRRLPQWDSSEHEEEFDDDIEILKPQMCSCRISCRSVRCSCAKAAKSCSSVCICINCGNPLNVLESIGINIEFSLKDRCLFQNIYRIPNLLDFLLREVKLSCCNTFARVQDCIPGALLCPNIECNVQIEFSWCRVIVCYPERNPRNHCSFCGQCCFSNGQHCMTCNRCYVKVSSKFPHCPTCRQEKPAPYDGQFHLNTLTQTQFHQANHQQSSSSKLSTKPEIVILNAYSISKDETNFESMECTTETEKVEDCSDDDFQNETTGEGFVLEQMDFEVQED